MRCSFEDNLRLLDFVTLRIGSPTSLIPQCLRRPPMSTSSYQGSIFCRSTTQFTTENVAIPRRVVKASWLSAIVIVLTILPLSVAAQGGNGAAVIGPNPNSTPYGCTTAP